MKRSHHLGAGVIFACSLLLSACGGSANEEPEAVPVEPQQPAAATVQEEVVESDPGVAALDAAMDDRGVVAIAIEGALSGDNASVEWEGDTMTITLDGDVENEVKPFQHCRVVGHFLEEGDTLILTYPNGSIDCADIPELEGELIW